MEVDNHYEYQNSSSSEVQYSSVFTKGYVLLGKTALFFSIGLIITAALALTLPLLYEALGWITLSSNHVISEISTEGAEGILWIVVISAIVIFIDVIVCSFTIFRSKNTYGALIPYLIYTIAMGGVLSVFCLMFDWYTLGIAFGATALSFISVGLLGYLSKGRLSWALIMIFSIMIGSIPLIIINIFLGSPLIYWLIEFGFLFVLYLFVFIDFRRLKEFVAAGETSNQVAIYCAFNLYYDFIYIFIKLLSIIQRLRNN